MAQKKLKQQVWSVAMATAAAVVVSSPVVSAGTRQFTEVPCNIPGVRNGSVAWGDFDNDGYLDLLIAGQTATGPVTRVFHNDGHGGFTDVVAGLAGINAVSCAWIDVNGDGYLDIALSGMTQQGKISRVYLNNHDQTFTPEEVELSEVPMPYMAWGDYDNDGRLDLVTGAPADAIPPQSILLYHKDAAGGFSAPPVPLGLFNGAAAWADIDNDGLIDLCISGAAGRQGGLLKTFRNSGRGKLTETRLPFGNLSGAAMAWGDFDNDGDLDLIITGASGKKLVTRLYRNNCGFANVPPEPPGGLQAILSGSSVTLTWDVAADVNQSGGLTYNLRIGTSPRGDNIVPCLAEPMHGYRRVPRIGNMNEQLSWSAELPEGKYYWSVQAIDHCYAGSEFAGEQTFEVQSLPSLLTQNAEPKAVFLTPVLKDTLEPAGSSPPPPSNPAPPASGPAAPASTPVSAAVTSTTTPAATVAYLIPQNSAQPISLPLPASGSVISQYALVDPPKHGQLSGVAPELTYQPDTNFFGLDDFTYSANDGSNRSATAEVEVVVAEVPHAPSSWLGIDQNRMLYLAGAPYHTYRIEASSDLQNWETLGSIEAENTPIAFADPDLTTYSARFYRAVLELPPAQLLNPHIDDAFRFNFPAEPGRNYEVEASTNLFDWELLAAFSAPSTNIIFADPFATNFPQRFYRVHSLP